MSDWAVAVVMPVFNEADGVEEFLRELDESLAEFETHFVVVDDGSTDSTVAVLTSLAEDGLPIEIIRSVANRGHGPATLHALSVGLELGPYAVVSIDGDGQFLGEDVANAVRLMFDHDLEVLEGVRCNRTDPWFRSATSAVTRLLVRHRCGEAPLDANTPLRVYRPDVLKRLLHAVPPGTVTPNLFISVLTRQWELRRLELPVRHRDRRGVGRCGSTWRARLQRVPSARFVKFCVLALLQWLALWKAAEF